MQLSPVAPRKGILQYMHFSALYLPSCFRNLEKSCFFEEISTSFIGCASMR